MKFLVSCIAALTLSIGAWAQGNCHRGNGPGHCNGQCQGQCSGQGDCRGQHDPANCPNPNCPKKQAADGGSQQNGGSGSQQSGSSGSQQGKSNR